MRPMRKGSGGVRCLDCGAEARADGKGTPIVLKHKPTCPTGKVPDVDQLSLEEARYVLHRIQAQRQMLVTEALVQVQKLRQQKAKLEGE